MPWGNIPEEESGENQGTDLARLRLHMTYLRRWQQSCDNKTEEMEKRLRVLEDYKLETVSRHRAMVSWLSVACASISTTIELLFRIFWKSTP